MPETKVQVRTEAPVVLHTRPALDMDEEHSSSSAG